MSLASLDLNLLRVLDSLLAERSVTRAARILGRTQPAVSNALRRLREVLDDEILVRGADGLVLTPYAASLREPLGEALALLGDRLFANAAFDPASATGLFRISTPDRLSLAVVPPLFDRLQRLAPGTDLHVMTADRKQALDLIDADRVDLALGWFDGKPRHLAAELLMEEQMYCVFRAAHPLTQRRAKFDLERILSFPHIVVSATGERAAIFDELLARRGLKRHALVSVANFTSVPHLLARSDMIGVFTHLAASVFEKSFGLAKRRVPVDIGKVATHIAWHARNDGDKRQMWLRDQIREVYADLRA